MERKDVYNLFDGERDYQDIRWSGKDNGSISVAEWISYMEYQLNKAKNCVYHLDKIGALEEIRKVGSLAVVCLENNDCPERVVETKSEFYLDGNN